MGAGEGGRANSMGGVANWVGGATAVPPILTTRLACLRGALIFFLLLLMLRVLQGEVVVGRTPHLSITGQANVAVVIS